jgi:hypothetical protein
MKALASVALLLLFSCSTALAHPGIGVVVDSRGNVYYTDLQQVWKVEPSGKRSVAVARVHTHELYLDEHDDLFGEHLWYEGERSDRWGHFVWRLSAGGEYTQLTSPTEGFLRNYSFVRDRAGNMYWASEARTSVMKRSPDRSVSTLAGGGPAGQDGRGAAAGFTAIRWMYAEPGGTTYLIDDGALRRLAPDGTVRTLARALDEERLAANPLFNPLGPGTLALAGLILGVALAAGSYRRLRRRQLRRAAFHLAWVLCLVLVTYGATLTVFAVILLSRSPHAVMGLCSDGAGTVYVANTGAGKLKRVTEAGEVSEVYASTGVFSPTGCAVAAEEIYVLEYGGPAVRVRKISRGGPAATPPAQVAVPRE